MLLGDLTPYQKQNAYYTGVQLGNDARKQTEIISKQTRALIKTQITSSDAIIASQERINEGIDNVAYGIERVEQGIYGLQATFEWGISEVVWQIEQNRAVLKNILEVLSAPLDTQAKELRKRAEEAYGNGWIDDALEDFLESEKKNKYDFSIHISLGHIYLFKKNDKEKALDCYEKAIKYAKPKSNYHASYALLHKALIKYTNGEIEEAAKCTSGAVELSPDFAEAIYQNAQYNAALNKPDKAIPLLKKAIKIDVNYCEKATNEKDFDIVRTHVKKLFEDLRDLEAKKIHIYYTTFQKKMDNFDNLINTVKKNEIIEIKNSEIKAFMKRVSELIKRNSFRDYLEANSIINIGCQGE